MQFGQQRYMQMMQKGEVVPPQSPLYATLQPIADKVASVANFAILHPVSFHHRERRFAERVFRAGRERLCHNLDVVVCEESRRTRRRALS